MCLTIVHRKRPESSGAKAEDGWSFQLRGASIQIGVTADKEQEALSKFMDAVIRW